MAAHRWKDLESKIPPERRERIRQRVREELLEMDLQQIRKALGLTQEELARKLEMSQGQVSETENRPDPRLSTLRRYVEALGGELEIVANFGDRRIRVHSA